MGYFRPRPSPFIVESAATAGGGTALNAGALLAPPAFGLLVDRLSYRSGWTLLAACMTVAGVRHRA